MTHEKEDGESGTAPLGGFKSNRFHRAEPEAEGTGWDAALMSRERRDGARHQS